MKLPKILIQQTLDWEYDSPTYRLVAKEVPYGYYGIEYVTEKLSSTDAMGNEIWIPTETTELSMVIAAIGQAILYPVINEECNSTLSGANDEKNDTMVPDRGLK